MQPADEQGYVIVAVNSDTVDYQDCARTLAKTIRHWDPSARICLVTDSPDTERYCFKNFYQSFTALFLICSLHPRFQLSTKKAGNRTLA